MQASMSRSPPANNCGPTSSSPRTARTRRHAPRCSAQNSRRSTSARASGGSPSRVPKHLHGLVLMRNQAGQAAGAIPLSDELCYVFILENAAERVRMDDAKLPELMADRLHAFTAPLMRAAAEAIPDGNLTYRPFDIMLMPTPWHRGRVVLIGDAAHSLTPQMTSGGGLALEDAVVLSRLVANGRADLRRARRVQRLSLPAGQTGLRRIAADLPMGADGRLRPLADVEAHGRDPRLSRRAVLMQHQVTFASGRARHWPVSSTSPTASAKASVDRRSSCCTASAAARTARRTSAKRACTSRSVMWPSGSTCVAAARAVASAARAVP